MLLAVHGAVSLDVDIGGQSNQSQLRSLALNVIGRSRWHDDSESGSVFGSGSGSVSVSVSSGGSPVNVVCLVSPSNMGYSIMNSLTPRFLNHLQEFIKHIESNPNMDENTISQFFNSYEPRLYSFFKQRLLQERKHNESVTMAKAKATAKASSTPFDKEKVDITEGMLRDHPVSMKISEFDTRMQATRDALGLPWRPHAYCIDNKKYCPGKNANQCCLYFPGIDPTLHEQLRLRLSDITKTRQSQTSQSSQSSLSSNLQLQFDSYTVCVLTIIFECDPTYGVIINTLWKGISLDRFVGQVTQLLDEFFSGVTGFDVSHSMSRTCLVDAACSDFSVPRKKVSIIGFERGRVETGRVSGLIDVHVPLETDLGFWGYWINHNPAEAARAAAGAMVVPKRQVYHSVVIPRELEDFVPECLTCNGSTIQRVEPVFDHEGNVVRVVYTYSDGNTEERDYVARAPKLPTRYTQQSMEALRGSPAPLLDDDDGGGGGGGGGGGVSVARPGVVNPAKVLGITRDIDFGGRRRIHKSSVQRRKHHHSNKKGKTVRRKMTRTRRSSRRSSRR